MTGSSSTPVRRPGFEVLPLTAFSVELATGLSTAYLRNMTSPELREDLKAFLGVQVNHNDHRLASISY
jgi:hypothetical protein